MNSPQPPSTELYIVYLFALLFSFYLGFTIVLIYLREAPLKPRIKYAVTAGLLSTKFVIFIATMLGIDHLFFYLRIGRLVIPVTSNLILFTSNLLAVLSLNWERISKYLTITEEEYLEIIGET